LKGGERVLNMIIITIPHFERWGKGLIMKIITIPHLERWGKGFEHDHYHNTPP
jgi:hypothetical protein